MVQGIVIPARLSEPVAQRTFERLEDYQSAVAGYIEPVELPSVGATMFANEEGLLRQLEFNSRATFLWWYHAPAPESYRSWWATWSSSVARIALDLRRICQSSFPT